MKWGHSTSAVDCLIPHLLCSVTPGLHSIYPPCFHHEQDLFDQPKWKKMYQGSHQSDYQQHFRVFPTSYQKFNNITNITKIWLQNIWMALQQLAAVWPINPHLCNRRREADIMNIVFISVNHTVVIDSWVLLSTAALLMLHAAGSRGSTAASSVSFLANISIPLLVSSLLLHTLHLHWLQHLLSSSSTSLPPFEVPSPAPPSPHSDLLILHHPPTPPPLSSFIQSASRPLSLHLAQTGSAHLAQELSSYRSRGLKSHS